MVRLTAEDIVFPEYVTVGNNSYNVFVDSETGGGSFNGSESNLTIGTKYLHSDPNYVWSVICHEIMEMIYVQFCVRYDDHSVEGNYKFFMDHKEFQNCISEFSKVIVQFLKTK
jgi:hypothetical protein